MCPVLVDEPVDPDISIEFQGQRVWFCCNRCRKDFLAAPDTYMAHLSQFGGMPPVSLPASTVPALAPRGPTPLELLGRTHIVLVHFPVALLMVAGCLEIARLASRRTTIWNATVVVLAFGAVSALAAMGTGLIHEESVEATADHFLLETHETLGIATGIVAPIALILVLAAIRTRKKPVRVLASLVVIASAALVAVTSHFGGSMVWGPNYLFRW